MNPVTFHSSLARQMIDFVTFKRMQGYDYIADARLLGYFDAFLVGEDYHLQLLTRQIVERYIAAGSHLKPRTRIGRLATVRGFTFHLNTLQPESYVLREYPFRVPREIRFYLYSPADIAALLKAIARPGLTRTMPAECLHLLVGLLHTVGLRISEALSLTMADVDLHKRTLFVHKGKFGKDRYVVLHSTTAERLCRWLQARSQYASGASSTPLLVNIRGRRLLGCNVRRVFKRCVRACNIGADAAVPPRLHDLRHTYACNCLTQWRRQGLDVNAMLPILSTALGHVSIRDTQIYLHIIPANLHEAAGTFRYVSQ